MNAAMLPPAFLATALTTMLTIAAISLSRKFGADGWVIPVLTILAIVSLGAFLLYLFAAVGTPLAGS